jgi:predicted transposase/invertase (TIGR01784 family)
MAENTDDKGYRRMLSDRRNFCDFVKNHIAAPWAEQIDADSLELVNPRFVTKGFKDREADIIYKARIKDGDVVFYVHMELQSEPDFTIPFRLLVYMTELLQRLFSEADKRARARKDFRLPAVVPIVLYNGSDKWSCAGSFKEYFANCELFAPNIIDFEYILFDINAPDEAVFLKTPTLMNLAMLADRKVDPKRVLHRLLKVLEASSRLTREEQLQMSAWISDVILKKAKLNKDTINGIRESFERKEETKMTYAIERALNELERRGRREGRREGEREGKLEMAVAMIGDGLSFETVSKYSGIPVDELRQSAEKRVPQ